MSTRVLATDEARGAIDQLQAVLAGDLSASLRHIERLGDTLARPDVWDGALAAGFRADQWPQCRAALRATEQSLDQLRQRLDAIQAGIMAAGGNA